LGNHYKKQLISKTAAMIRWGTAIQMKLDVLSAVHFTAETQRLIISTTIKNFSVKCGFSNNHVSSNDDSAVKLSEDEQDDWHSSQPLGVQSGALEVSQVQSVDQVSDQHLTRSEEEPEEEEEAAEHKGTILDALKGLKAARKYMCQIDMENNIIVICNNVGYEQYTYRLRAHGE
jgi:hypothetical protein